MNFPWADPGIAHYKHTQCISLSFNEEPSLIFHKSPHFTQEFILMSRAWGYTPLPTLSMWQLLSRCHTKKEGHLLSLHLYTCRPLLGRVNKMATLLRFYLSQSSAEGALESLDSCYWISFQSHVYNTFCLKLLYCCSIEIHV